MGFFDKALKNIVKSPLGKAALLGAGAYFGGPGIMNLLKNPKVLGPMGKSLWAKPLISKPLTSAASSYGLAKLMRARNPEKAALWGALTTLPFLGSEAMAASKAATEAGNKTSMWDVLLGRPTMPGTDIIPKNYARSLAETDASRFYEEAVGGGYRPNEMLTSLPSNTAPANIATKAATKSTTMPDLYDFVNKNYAKQNKIPADLSYFMKDPTELKAMTEGTATGMAQFLPKSKFDVLNTLVPTLAGVYGAREYDDQKWDRIKKQRKEQLAFMYGVDPEDIEGEMDNPYYNITPPALDFKYANQGGIMNLDMGGDISGPGTGTSDSINAKVSDGEFIFTNKAVERFGGGDRQKGAQRMYAMMNQLDPQSETPQEGMV